MSVCSAVNAIVLPFLPPPMPFLPLLSTQVAQPCFSDELLLTGYSSLKSKCGESA